ncbi:hypothetical protein JCM9140_4032 [Halalkalibacter wakoensis JCM 9140]|uniref:Lipoprotein n=1 Tax=Halalkalibacter wakoensis JCM 9140 TaxID=1236970 RepID=W4Q8Y5_9BACI|nr:hypothetical protein [Halalkalibacter wakoensis]GAE27869.1 hypothetical protein JCM9140_4032 [Halalkalibacter wakoensis JCM 9140]
MKYLFIFFTAILLASCAETDVQEPVQEEPTEAIEDIEHPDEGNSANEDEPKKKWG